MKKMYCVDLTQKLLWNLTWARWLWHGYSSLTFHLKWLVSSRNSLTSQEVIFWAIKQTKSSKVDIGSKAIVCQISRKRVCLNLNKSSLRTLKDQLKISREFFKSLRKSRSRMIAKRKYLRTVFSPWKCSNLHLKSQMSHQLKTLNLISFRIMDKTVKWSLWILVRTLVNSKLLALQLLIKAATSDPNTKTNRFMRLTSRRK